MTKRQGAALDRKKLFADPIMVTTVVVLIAFLTLFIIYPLAILLVDSFISPDGGGFTLSVFKRIFDMWTFRTAIGNTLKVGFMVGIGSALSACCSPMSKCMSRSAVNSWAACSR